MSKPVISRKTVYAGLQIDGGGPLPGLIRQVLQETITLVSSAVQSILLQLEDSLESDFNSENQLNWVDLFIPCKTRDLKRAFENVAKERRKAPTDKGDKENARPQYKNSYHLEEMIGRGDFNYLRFRIAEAFFWRASRGEVKGKLLRDLNMIDVTQGLQQVIMGWLRPELNHLPLASRAGVCQQAAQQLLSHIGLINKPIQPKTTFPNLEIRDAAAVEERRLRLLEKLAGRTQPFEYKTARELKPGQYDETDKRGDRLVNVDPDWLAFIGDSEPRPLPVNFVKSSDIVVYRREWPAGRQAEELKRNPQRGSQYPVNRSRATRQTSRLYAALPLFKNVPPDSTLGRLARQEKLFWWRRHLAEFRVLPAWPDKRLSAKDPMLLVPLQYDPPKINKPSRFESVLSGLNGFEVNWSLLVQKGYGLKAKWEIHFAVSRQVADSRQVLLRRREKILGVHFGADQKIYWALINQTGGDIIQEGNLAMTVLDEALQAKLKLEEVQDTLAWVGGQRFGAELKRQTYAVAKTIVQLAADLGANLALEEINFVDKKKGGPKANLRFSLWNYSNLARAIEDKGLDHNDPVPVAARISDYWLRFTCPVCGAVRKAKEEKGEETTIFQNGFLICRKCNFSGAVSDEAQARLTARLGAKRLAIRLSA